MAKTGESYKNKQGNNNGQQDRNFGLPDEDRFINYALKLESALRKFWSRMELTPEEGSAVDEFHRDLLSIKKAQKAYGQKGSTALRRILNTALSILGHSKENDPISCRVALKILSQRYHYMHSRMMASNELKGLPVLLCSWCARISDRLADSGATGQALLSFLEGVISYVG